MRKFWFLVLSVLLTSSLLFADTDNGTGRGGGSMRICHATSENHYSGPYFYDYLQTRDKNSDEFPFEGLSDCYGYVDQIVKKLWEVNPTLAAGLSSFLFAYMTNVPGLTNPQTAKKEFKIKRYSIYCDERNCLYNTAESDPPENKNFPKNCGTRVQLAVRESIGDNQVGITYNHNEFRNLQRLDSKNPLDRKTGAQQCSYFLIHEWLRDFYPVDSNGIQNVQDFNRYLHSTSFFTASKEALNQKLSAQKIPLIEVKCPTRRPTDRALNNMEEFYFLLLKAYEDQLFKNPKDQ